MWCGEVAGRHILLRLTSQPNNLGMMREFSREYWKVRWKDNKAMAQYNIQQSYLNLTASVSYCLMRFTWVLDAVSSIFGSNIPSGLVCEE